MDSMTDAGMPPGFDPRPRMAPWPFPWAPWLQLTQSAFDAWIELWTAALPQRQAELLLRVQRQALEAWTTPWAWAAPLPRPHPQPAQQTMPPLPRAIPAEAPRPEAVVPAQAEPEIPGTAEPETAQPDMRKPDAEEAASAEPIGAAPPEEAPLPAREAAKPAVELRQPGSRKTQLQARHPHPKNRR